MLSTRVYMEELSLPVDRVLDTVPLVVDERQVTRFKFYLQAQIRTGMLYNQELYGLVREVHSRDRLEAYRLGCELLLQGVPILMTASRQHYTLWLNLRHSSGIPHQLL